MKVQMSGDKSRSKALGFVASTHGVQSVAIEGREMNHLVVVGDGLDAVSLTTYLRRKVGSAQIIQVEVIRGGAADKTKPSATTTIAVASGPQQQRQPRYYNSYYSRPAAVHPYTQHSYYEYDDSHPEAGSSCAIM
ncbi:unnamed protein product [Urochloa decumbens]|uniref:HMA domain-containing protein n=1 Tax=Urochloa decumbens TaxID=240449 RepID=A0ABC9D548_9POAL